MAEFTDTANAVDNTGFSDSLGDATTSTPQGIPDSTATTNTGDSSPAPPDATGSDTVTTGDTAPQKNRTFIFCYNSYKPNSRNTKRKYWKPPRLLQSKRRTRFRVWS